MRIGMVCPYTWDVPGGVQAHVRDLAEHLLAGGHEVSVFTPVDDEASLPDYAVGAGKPVPVPYNGSVARLLLGPVSAGRARRWLRRGDFDLLHVHEPIAPSVTWVSCMLAESPIVATFHTSNPRSRAMVAFEPLVVPALEKVSARIAVSEAARRTTVEHLGGDAILIPNGVDVARFAGAPYLPGRPDGRTLAFLGRVDEPRKGLVVLLDALRFLPHDVRLLVAGPGEPDVPRDLQDRVEVLGLVDEPTKASVLRSADLYVAPNTGGESFGIVLLEAMSAGTAVVASDLDAFRTVLAGTGALFPPGDPERLAETARALLADAGRRDALAAAAASEAARYDWSVITRRILDVYDTVLEGHSLLLAAQNAPPSVP